MRRLAFVVVTASLLALFGGSGRHALAQDSIKGQVQSVNGMQMYYEVRGAGPPLVLLHGFFGCGQLWQPVLQQLSKHYRVVTPDLRGHGRSTNPSGEFTHRQSARDVFALLDRLGIRHFKAMGFSTGGMTLLHMATQQPDRVEAMILIGATIYFPEPARQVMNRVSTESLPPQVSEALATVRDARRTPDSRTRVGVSSLQGQLRRYEFHTAASPDDCCSDADCARRSRCVFPGRHTDRDVPVDSSLIPLDRSQWASRRTDRRRYG